MIDVKKIQWVNDTLIIEEAELWKTESWLKIVSDNTKKNKKYIYWKVLSKWPNCSRNIDLGDMVFFPPFSYQIIECPTKPWEYIIAIREINILCKL